MVDNENKKYPSKQNLVKTSDENEPLDTSEVLSRLTQSEHAIDTSLGPNFNNAFFGRDSIISAIELLGLENSNESEKYTETVHKVILKMAGNQGTKDRMLSGEQFGKMHHEQRNFETWQAKSTIEKIGIKTVSCAWGGNFRSMTTYFSLDSTPRFTELVSGYAKKHPEILAEKIARNDGKEINIAQSVEDANKWITNNIAASGLVEVGNSNPLGLPHQTWKDSLTGYIQENGQLANTSKPIAYLEIQALAADSLLAAAKLMPENENATSWKQTAESIIKATIEKFWVEDEQFFAAAIDKDKNGDERVLKTVQSDAGRILNSSIFDNLPENERIKYVSAIVKELFSDDFLTDVGLRGRSVEYANKVGMADYHGSQASWPIDTYLIAKGLRRQGMPKLAEQLESRIINAANLSGDHYEFFYVLPNGNAITDPEAAKKKREGTENLEIQMYPEPNIAWSVVSIAAIKHNNENNSKTEHVDDGSWQNELEKEILANIKNVNIAKSSDEKPITEEKDVYLDKKGLVQIMAKEIKKKLFGSKK